MRWLIAALCVLVLAGAGLWALGRGAGGGHDSERGAPAALARAQAELAAEAARQRAAGEGVGAPRDGEQIVFGDLHVHTTISFDAFMLNLPVTGGQGPATLADACDFARHCAALDFWSLNDHASNILPLDWQRSVESVRQCNALAGDPADPDTVAFLGWEWTQAGATPDTHYGHKNVVLAHTDDARIPARPIAADPGGLAASPPPVWARGLAALGDARFRDLALRWTTLSELRECGAGPSPELPRDCREVARTPAELFRKLDEWGLDALVIPHGTSWGIYTPAPASWQKQLAGAMHDPARQRLIEIYSGHGNAEEWRDWSAVEPDADGSPRCPEARADHLPMCRRAGEIVRERCLSEGATAEDCEARAARARSHTAAAGISPQVSVPGATSADWRDAGQCRDCAQPAFSHRPGGSVQAIAALGDFEADPERPRRFRLGFLASSDIHTARPGTGYKELRALSETRDLSPPSGGIAAAFFAGEPEAPTAHSRGYDEAARSLRGFQLFETERTRSFLYTGGLVAAHARGRDRAAIWEALQERRVYGTSGPRILLWFDLLSEGGLAAMGSERAQRDAPVLRVRAVGSLEQRPGCPERVIEALGAERTARLCHDECYRPSERRRVVERIEVVKITPRLRPDEPLSERIEDPWRRFDCPPDPAGCIATFVDEDYAREGRDALYYARVLEAPAPTVNGDPLRCARDAEGDCLAVDLCDAGDHCLSPWSARAWSSPIWVDFR